MSAEKPVWEAEMEGLERCTVDLPSYGMKAEGVFCWGEGGKRLVINLLDGDENKTWQGMLVGRIEEREGERVLLVDKVGELPSDEKWAALLEQLKNNDLIYDFTGELVHLAAWMGKGLGVKRLIWEGRVEIGTEEEGFLESMATLLGPASERRVWGMRELGESEREFYDTGKADLGGGVSVEMGFPEVSLPSVFRLKMKIEDEVVGYLQGDIYSLPGKRQLLVETIEDLTEFGPEEREGEVYQETELFLRTLVDKVDDEWVADSLRNKMMYLALRYLHYWYGRVEVVLDNGLTREWDEELVEQVTEKWLEF